MVGLWIGNDFLNGSLFTTEQDVSIRYSKKRKPRLFFNNPSHQTLPPRSHNRKKQYLIQVEDAPYLQPMGIASTKGNILPQGQAKFRQINKYIEIINNLLKQQPLPKGPHIVDMGSGKGYLTFALYHFSEKRMEPATCHHRHRTAGETRALLQ